MRKDLTASNSSSRPYSYEQIVSAWSIQAVLITKHITVIKRPDGCKIERVRVQAKITRAGGESSFVLYRREIYRLISSPKSDFDQLCITLPCLMSFRTMETATWRAEYIHFNVGDCSVMDAKKKRLMPVPLNTLVARLVESVLNGRSEGYVLRSRSSGGRGRGLNKPLSDVAIWKVWKYHASRLNLFPSPDEYSPIVGRRFFAAEWFYALGLSLATLSKIMRHNDIPTTSRYVLHLIFYEDLKRDYDSFQFKVMDEMTKQNMENLRYVEG